MQVPIYNQVNRTEPPLNRIEVVLDERRIFQLEVSVGGRDLLTGDCVEPARGTGSGNRPIPGRGVGRARHRDVDADVASGGLR